MTSLLSAVPMRLAYPARFHPAGIGYVITFRDLPAAVTQGETRKDARAMAADALTSAVEFYVDGYRSVPEPSEPLPGEELVHLPQGLSALVAALNESISLGVHKQVFLRIADRRHDGRRTT